jgi:NDP-sugar pyrophosphorylase family protein
MRAIILAAGKGERLKSIVQNMPKPMVAINGKPILLQTIEWLKEYGITDLYINLHHQPDSIRNYFQNGKCFGVSITYSFEQQLLGTSGAVKKIAADFWNEQNSPFMVLYGDNLFKGNLKKILDYHTEKKGLVTVVLHKKEDVSQSGIVVLDNNNRIIRFVEKPKPEETISNLVNAALYVCEPQLLHYIPVEGPSDFGRDIFPVLLKTNKTMFGIIIDGSVTAIDTPEFYHQALGAQP